MLVVKCTTNETRCVGLKNSIPVCSKSLQRDVASKDNVNGYLKRIIFLFFQDLPYVNDEILMRCSCMESHKPVLFTSTSDRSQVRNSIYLSRKKYPSLPCQLQRKGCDGRRYHKKKKTKQSTYCLCRKL